MPRPRRVLAIALDAAEPSLVERWMGDGTLPNLRSLRRQGAYGRLKSSADWLAGSPWPTFYTGTPPEEHGLYETKQWNAKRMTQVQAGPEWLPIRPFWRDLGKNGVRVVSVDLPMTYLPEPMDGVEICGWMTYDSIGNMGKAVSYPQSEIRRLRDELDLRPPRITSERVGVQTARSLLSLRDQLVGATENMAELSERLMARKRWDLFMVSFASTHRGGHKLWDLSGTVGRVGAGERRRLCVALRDVYAACDGAVGRLVAAAGDGADVLVFSLHGMGPNNDRTFLLSKTLDSILHGKRARARPSGGGIQAARRAREGAARWLPMAFPPSSKAWKLAVAVYHSQGVWRMRPKADAKAFRVLSCLNGCIRISLRGRERDGVVEPGEEYDRLCSDITEGFMTFVDADTGEPIVERAARSDRLFGPGARLEFLPDIIVKWAAAPAINSRRVVSSRFPEASFSMPLRNLNGRSGNHAPEGFLLARGRGIAPGTSIHGGDILDLAPTILGMLGVEKPERMRGRALLGAGGKGAPL